MGITFWVIDTDVGRFKIDADHSDGKALPDVAWPTEFMGGDRLVEWLRKEGVWTFPLHRPSDWQAPARFFRAAHGANEALKRAKHRVPGVDEDWLSALADELQGLERALRQAISKGAREARVEPPGPCDEIEAARSNRSRCRACKKPIAAGRLRFGEDIPAFASLVWHHLDCGAARGRPFLRALKRYSGSVDGKARLKKKAERALAEFEHPEFEKAATGRARCVVCATAIPKDSVRLASAETFVEARGLRQVYAHPPCAPLLLEGWSGLARTELIRLLRKNTKSAVSVDWNATEAAFVALERA